MDARTMPSRAQLCLLPEKPTPNIVLNVKTLPISGSVTLNGKLPELGCKYTSDGVMQVTFKETTWGYTFTRTHYCKTGGFTAGSNGTPVDAKKAVAWNMVVYPGTYKVTVSGYDPYGSTYKNASNLPTVKQIIHKALKIQQPTPNIVLNVQTIAIAGTVTLNGKLPGITCKYTSDGVMQVTFKETTWGYTFTRTNYCKTGGFSAGSNGTPVDANKAFSWALVVYPGTYRVTVSGYDPYGSTYKNASTLPTVAQIVVPKLLVK